MDATRLKQLLWAVLLAVTTLHTRAQTELPLANTGTLAAGTPQVVTFSAREGTILSFLVQATDGQLDPALRLLNASGDALTANDDYDYPDRTDALIEAFTVPRTGDYTLEVSAVNPEGGDYRLSVVEGLPTVILADSFEASTALNLTTADTNLIMAQANGDVTLSVEGIEQDGLAVHSGTGADIFYASVDVQSVTHRNGWVLGMVLRLQGDGSHYRLEIDHRGIWRMLLIQNDTEQIIRDWTDHPALIADQTAFRISVFAGDGGFNVFYDGQYVGTAADTTLTQPGQLGLYVRTKNSPDSSVTAAFDNLVISVPTTLEGTVLLPTQLVDGSAPYMARQLQHMSVIPVGGEQALDLPETTASYNDAGISEIPIARNATFTNFVYSAQVAITTNRQGISGCGMLARRTDDGYVVAYTDNSGGYGLAVRADDEFTLSNFGQSADMPVEVWLLLIARGDSVTLYVDGRLFATLPVAQTAGEIGSAVLNFDPQDTTCRLRDVWLWRWSSS